MAHQLTQDQIDSLAAEDAALTTKQIDELAADEAANAGGAATGPILAAGAEGPDVTKLVNLLAVLGYKTNSVIKGGPATLDETVLVDVHAAQAKLGVAEAEGVVVGAPTWGALYNAAAVKLEAAGAVGA